ncbi:retrovirus-related pol polyprotein from transposon TNT 1-94 [Tanacetum coccineum]
MSGDNGEKPTQKITAMGDNNGEKLLQRKTISPYDITANDNTGSLITQVELKGENYDEWARSLRTALRARKKFGFVDGTIKQPDDKSPDLEDWWTNNSLIVSWIMNTIEPLLRSTISHIKVAEDLWKDIKERFFMANGPRIHQLKAKLTNCKQLGLSLSGGRNVSVGQDKHQDKHKYRRGGGVKANVFQSSTSGARRNDVVSDVDRVAVIELNNDQWETLKNILNPTKIRANEKLTGKHTFIQWIYDSGASYHMTGWLQCMSEVRDIMTECEQREGLYFYKRMVNVMDVTARDVGVSNLHKRYLYGKKGWRVFDLESHTFLVSRDVVFYEDEFPYLKHNTGTTSHETNDHIQGSMKDWCDLDNDGNEVRHSVNHEEEHFLAAIASGFVPQTFKEAMKDEN